MFKVPTFNKNEKGRGNNTKKWKGFSVSLSRFELDDVSDLKIIGKLVLKLFNVSKSVTEIWCTATKF